MMTPSESGGSGGTRLTLSKRYSACLRSDGQAASATDSLRESREHDPTPPLWRHSGTLAQATVRGPGPTRLLPMSSPTFVLHGATYPTSGLLTYEQSSPLATIFSPCTG